MGHGTHDALPANGATGIFHDDDIVGVEHRHQAFFQLAFPQRSVVERGFHGFVRTAVGKPAHEEEGVRIVNRWKWTEDSYPADWRRVP